jgi:hypothetical protein
MEILLILIVCAVPITLIWGSNTACIKCNKWFGRTTTSDEKLDVEESETLVEGATRMDGELDQRYNNRVRVDETGIRHREFKCSSCDHLWEERKPYKSSYTYSA